MRRIIYTLLLALLVSSCGSSQCDKNTASTQIKATEYQKKYTNKDFYQNGVFNKEVALQAIKDMIEFYGLPYTEFMKENLWVNDFGLGDFENLGMGGIFWVNNKEYSYFAHTIYLLPNQMIPEHAHLETTMPAKHETWKVAHGWGYSFTEFGEPTPNAPAVPESHGPTKCKYFEIKKVGDMNALQKIECYHYLRAGDQGIIADEWANYHDNAGVTFTNKKAVM